MDKYELIKALKDGKVLINEKGDRLFKDRSDDHYVLIGNGFISRTEKYEMEDIAPTIIHFGTLYTIGGKDIMIGKFTVGSEAWSVKDD